jgi:general secretion pathway protein G
MALRIRSGEIFMTTPPPKQRQSGFTLIEMMVVMAIIAVLMSVAIPIYTRAILRAKESVLKNNLFTLRTVIDEYTYDKQKAPQSPEDLVSDGYLRQVPLDPMTGAADWKVVMEDATNTVNQSQPGIYDVHSASDKTSMEGTPYSDW